VEGKGWACLRPSATASTRSWRASVEDFIAGDGETSEAQLEEDTFHMLWLVERLKALEGPALWTRWTRTAGRNGYSRDGGLMAGSGSRTARNRFQTVAVLRFPPYRGGTATRTAWAGTAAAG
jgi:hypothetical protein